jgi:hypothetical protein
MTQRLFSSQKKWTIKSLVIASVCAIIPASTSFAASDFTPGNVAGSKALLFSFSGLSVLGGGAFNGGIGGKYYLTEPLALRAGLQFLTASQSLPANPAVGQPGTDGSRSATQIGINAAIEYHLAKARVSPFVGGGILFSSTSTDYKSPVAGTGATVETQNARAGEVIDGTTYTGGLSLGFAGLGGIEFFITQELSLSAEYQLGFAMKNRYAEKVVNGLETKVGGTNTFGITASGLLTLAVYF